MSVRYLCRHTTLLLRVPLYGLVRRIHRGVGGIFFERWRLLIAVGDHAFTLVGLWGLLSFSRFYEEAGVT